MNGNVSQQVVRRATVETWIAVTTLLQRTIHDADVVTPFVRHRTALRFAAAALTIVMIAVLAHALRRDGPAALNAWRAADIQWPWVTFSVTCALTGHAVYVAGWRRLLGDSGVRASYWTLARLFLVSNLGRYLPAGKAWQMAIVAMMAAERRLPSAMLAGSSLFQGAVGLCVGAIVVFAAGSTTIGLPPAWLVLPVAAIVGLLVAPRVLRSITRLHAAIKRHVPGIESVSAATMWTLIWTSAASWILWGIALLGLAHALVPTLESSITAYIAAWTGSFLAGLIALVSPAGLGARETVMQAVLVRMGMRPADVLVLVVVARVWVTVLDVIPAAIILLSRRRSRDHADAQLQQPAPSERSSSIVLARGRSPAASVLARPHGHDADHRLVRSRVPLA